MVAIANSRHCLVDEDGLDLTTWPEALAEAPAQTLEEFTQLIISRNLRNSIFVDVTANPAAAGIYAALLAKSVAVVACNKVAASSDYAQLRPPEKPVEGVQRQLSCSKPTWARPCPSSARSTTSRAAATWCGAWRPCSRARSTSCSITTTARRPFAEVVRQAQAEGYTEPDPRLDLSGSDVARKILILAREAGQAMEMSDIEIETFLPPACLEGDVEAFYTQMAAHEAAFSAPCTRRPPAAGKRLKFVARYAEGQRRRRPAAGSARPRPLRPARQRQRGAVLHRPLRRAAAGGERRRRGRGGHGLGRIRATSSAPPGCRRLTVNNRRIKNYGHEAMLWPVLILHP